MKNIANKIIFAVIGTAFYLSVLMWLYNAVYFLRDPGYLLANPIPFWTVVIVMMIGAALVLRIVGRPIVAAAKRIEKGEFSNEFIEPARKVLKRLPSIIIVFDALAFLIGPVAAILAGAARGAFALDPSRIIFTVFFSLGVGLMAGIQAIYLVAIVVQDLRANLKIYALDPNEPVRSKRKQYIAVALATAYFFAAMFISSGYGFLNQGAADWHGTFFLDTAILLVFCAGIAWITVWAAATDEKRRILRIKKALDALTRTDVLEFERLDTISPDELGQLTEAINAFMLHQEQANTSLRTTAQKMVESVKLLERSITDTSGVVNGTLAALEKLKSQGIEQNGAIGAVEKVLETLVDSIERVSANVDTQASYVEESSSAITQMSANIGSVSESTKKAEKLAEDLQKAADVGAQSVRDSVEAIREIERTAHEVSEIVRAIGKISSQTNLLAMNAAIEAAHAGDLGAGFAGVADEVRNLANDSSRSAKAIAQKIHEMIGRVERGVQESGKASESFVAVRDSVARTRELTGMIADAMAEQASGAQEILGSVNNLVQATATINTSSTEQRTQSRLIRERMDALKASFDEVSQAVANQETQTDHLVETISNLESICEQSRQVSAELEELNR